MRTLIALILLASTLLAVAVLPVLAGGRRGAYEPGGDPNLISTATTQPRSQPTEGKNVYSKSGFDLTRLSREKIDALAVKLNAEERRIILSQGTEPAFCGTLLDNKKEGVYVCKLCGLPLFASDHKFNSGTGWPSFYRPYDLEHIEYKQDDSHGMKRIEINCQRCGGHLGHVFEDGPKPTGLRYCLNGASLTFFDKGATLPPESTPVKTETAYFAGGCFWGVEDRFQMTPGVIDAVSGYMGGATKNPTYKQVCYEDTGHAETVKVVYDPSKIAYKDLLKAFFRYHDATTLNRQGPDVGEQYRSAIFTVDQAQQDAAKAYIEELSKKPKYQARRIVTQVVPVATAGEFYAAEDYHQDYHVKNGGHCGLPPADEDE